MKNRILKFYEKALNSLMFAFLYLLVFIALIAIGGWMISRFPPFFKLAGVGVIGLALYFLAYYPLLKSKK